MDEIFLQVHPSAIENNQFYLSRDESYHFLKSLIIKLFEERKRWVPTRDLQYLLAEALVDHNPPPVKGYRGQRLQVTRLRQVDINPPTFLFTVNEPGLVHFSYKRYLENKIRDTFGFDRTHLRLVFKRN